MKSAAAIFLISLNSAFRPAGSLRIVNILAIVEGCIRCWKRSAGVAPEITGGVGGGVLEDIIPGSEVYHSSVP